MSSALLQVRYVHCSASPAGSAGDWLHGVGEVQGRAPHVADPRASGAVGKRQGDGHEHRLQPCRLLDFKMLFVIVVVVVLLLVVVLVLVPVLFLFLLFFFFFFLFLFLFLFLFWFFFLLFGFVVGSNCCWVEV